MAIVHAWIENYEIDTKTEYLDFTNHSNPYCRKLAQDVINGNNPQLKQVPKHSKEYLQVRYCINHCCVHKNMDYPYFYAQIHNG